MVHSIAKAVFKICALLNRSWGRNWEVASEDPFLTGEIGTNYAVGFQQGSDARYLLGVLTLKHWAAYTV